MGQSLTKEELRSAMQSELGAYFVCALPPNSASQDPNTSSSCAALVCNWLFLSIGVRQLAFIGIESDRSAFPLFPPMYCCFPVIFMILCFLHLQCTNNIRSFVLINHLG
jgi:hypothetical protein